MVGGWEVGRGGRGGGVGREEAKAPQVKQLLAGPKKRISIFVRTWSVFADLVTYFVLRSTKMPPICKV